MKRNLIAGNIEIFYKDLPKRDLRKGQALCSALKGGTWRLPSLKELGYLYELHKLGILNLDPAGIYWSDRRTDRDMCAVINFGTGSYSSKSVFTELSVRPVRDI